MNKPYLAISRLQRRLSTGNVEELIFERGVNLLVGRPNTGKTKWLQTLDFLLGDTGDNPYEGEDETGLAEKYDAASAEISIGTERFFIERRWKERGVKSKVFVDDVSMSASDFQNWLMEKLHIPSLNFPKGNPMSGQTWPELSFRMLLRHIYRQQRFWGAIADQQPDGEQHACLLQFLGLAEKVYTDVYGELVDLKMKAEKLKARREQFNQTLEDLTRDLLDEPDLSVSINANSIKIALERLTTEMDFLLQKRKIGLAFGQEAISDDQRSHVSILSEKRAFAIVKIEELQTKQKAVFERIMEIQRYFEDISNEINRISRAEDASSILSDLKITHCPACDQSVSEKTHHPDHCFLCDQPLPDDPAMAELGAVRLRFERDRLEGEQSEATGLLTILRRDHAAINLELKKHEEFLIAIDSELKPAREAVASLAQEEISAIDRELGQLSERERQIKRVLTAFDVGEDLTHQIRLLEKQIEPLQRQVDEFIRSTDFEGASELLENGMNEYLNAINKLRPGVWRHSSVNIDISRYNFKIRVGRRGWQQALGGTDTLYFLMSYHYGLLTLSNKANCHYPGFSLIDLPGEFSGEEVEDKENFIVQPFVDLLERPEFSAAQLIMTGASFKDLEGAHFQKLTQVHAS